MNALLRRLVPARQAPEAKPMLPWAFQGEDGEDYFGEDYFGEGHIEPHRFVLAMLQEHFTLVGAGEAMEMLFGDDGSIRWRQGLDVDRKTHIAQLIDSVEHLWGREDPDNEEHKGLDDAHIEYVWRDKASKSKGRIVLAKARKVGGLNAYLANMSAGLVDSEANDPLFVIEVAADMWERLSPAQRIALVDHELCHLWCEVDDEGHQELGVRGHDLEEFSCIVERHGLWKGDVEAFGHEVIGQLALAIEADARFLDDLGIDPDAKDPRNEGDAP